MPSRHPISEKLDAPDVDGFTKIIKLGEKRITRSASEIGRDRDFHRRGIALVGRSAKSISLRGVDGYEQSRGWGEGKNNEIEEREARYLNNVIRSQICKIRRLNRESERQKLTPPKRTEEKVVFLYRTSFANYSFLLKQRCRRINPNLAYVEFLAGISLYLSNITMLSNSS